LSQENVEIVRCLYDTADTSGWDAAIASPVIHDDSETTFKAGPQAGTHKAAYRYGQCSTTSGGFETWIVEPLELIESRDQVVAIINNRFRPRGGASGEFEYRNGSVWTIRDGTFRSVVGYPTPEDALEAAGLTGRRRSPCAPRTNSRVR
jgi:ketosteroid isomerase-like protein